MKNTWITYSSEERTPVILTELAELLPPLGEEQLSVLETDILTNGCYSPIVVDEELRIIDGHHRQKICAEHILPTSCSPSGSGYGNTVPVSRAVPRMLRICSSPTQPGPCWPTANSSSC